MQNEWQTFLSQNGGKIGAQGMMYFSANKREDMAQLDTGCLLIPLDCFGVIHVTGEDAQTFLQGQFTNDITLLDASSAQISAYCNPKGRMLAQMLIIPNGSDYYLILPVAILEKTLARLRMFVLRSQVTLTDVSSEMVCLGIAGTQLDSSHLVLPETDYGLTNSDQILTTRIPASPRRYLLLMSSEKAQSFWQSMTQQCRPVSAHVWQWLDIQAGLPNVLAETVEEFVPQMVNLELIGGVSFKKGCYTGQEIVARMHYLGKPKRRMFRLHTETEDVPPPGEDLYLHGGDGQSAGKVVMAQPSPVKGTDLLAVIRLNHANSDSLRLGAEDGPHLEFLSLPYSPESE